MIAKELAQDFAVAIGKTISVQIVYRHLAEKALYARRPNVCRPTQKRARLLWSQEHVSRGNQKWGHS
ncbi:hypothetical protein TNCV_223931 [Trichonephila clavipes]|nr:hypothetical protein TNCV_223931 [Trichonephila clavipes]